MEADSLNCSLLGRTLPILKNFLFVGGGPRLTTKAGQRCTTRDPAYHCSRAVYCSGDPLKKIISILVDPGP